ncbi:DUF1513 domain-containing protein [Nitrogeniibacter aestuarii]|uniref:DUF1513 domain-containing protein n=1 Tax=Nitrogeniibacter aestuarii TaxID=2815343 RepID=UPI001D11F18A|nr:DUF1513 domain-containing protein [Nitrogeniibacter aestuarii]
MAIDRRHFLKGLAAVAAGATTSRLVASPQGAQLLSCRADGGGRYFATLFDTTGRVLLDLPLPARGHDIALSRDGRTAVVVARRPGDFLRVIDVVERTLVASLRSAPDRHYFGHGVFSADGRLFYVVENDFEAGEGRIGVLDTTDGWRKVDEFASHGVGPHELLLAADDETLVVANGGILTHPDTPRAKLNLPTMAPNLAYVDRKTGALLEKVEPPAQWHQLSIRHIALGADDRVAIAMQYEGDKADDPPMMALHRRGQPLQMLWAPDDIRHRLQHYCGSVAFTEDGSRFAVSSPRGGVVLNWSAEGDYLGHHEQGDVCGLAAADGELWASDGHGRLEPVGDATRRADFAQVRWDNHMVAVRRS